MNKVAFFREAKGWSQADLSRMSGVSPSQVSRIEAGAITPSIEMARALARALGVTVDAAFPDERAAV